MANRCDSVVKMATTSKQVSDQLWSAIEMLGIERKDAYLSKLAKAVGIDYEARDIDMRGVIYGTDYEEDIELDEYVTTLYIDSAWSVPLDFLNALNEVFDRAFSISYRSIEPGCGIHAVHDERNFFPEECHVDCFGEPFGERDADLYDTIGEAIQLWCALTGETTKGRTTEQMIEYINAYAYANPDTYFYIYPFTFE